jgi:hypothetical protein
METLWQYAGLMVALAVIVFALFIAADFLADALRKIGNIPPRDRNDPENWL